MSNTSENNIETCRYCGVSDRRVEASGMWYCPNVLCTSPGTLWFRSTLPSYKDLGNHEYSVNREELDTLGKEYLKTKEPAIYAFLFPSNSVLLSFPNKRYLQDFLSWVQSQSKFPFDIPQTGLGDAKLAVTVQAGTVSFTNA